MFISFSAEAVAERRVRRLRKNVWLSGQIHALNRPAGFRPLVTHLVTLTYANPDDWSPRDISTAISAYRRWCKFHGYECIYTWVAEIQPGRLEKTGKSVVHYHIVCWLPSGARMPKWDRRVVMSRSVERFWVHGFTNRILATKGVGYVMKYLSKLGALTVFPKGLRLYGMGGLTPMAKSVRSWHGLPTWIKSIYGVGDVVRKNFGIVCRATGEVLDPLYKVVNCSKEGLNLILRRQPPARFFDGPYSNLAFA